MLSKAVVQIEAEAKKTLRFDEVRHANRQENVNAAIGLLSNLFPEVAGGERKSAIAELLFERALILFEEGRSAGNVFSSAFEEFPLLDALLSAVEYQGTIREVPIIEDYESLEQVFQLAELHWNSRLADRIIQLLIHRYLTLQVSSYKSVLIKSTLLLKNVMQAQDRGIKKGQILRQLNSALWNQANLKSHIKNRQITDPIKYLSSIGFSSQDLHGEFIQAFSLAWIVALPSREKPSTEMITHLNSHVGNAEFRMVLWAHLVVKYENNQTNWDVIFPKIMSELPDFGNTALWRVTQPHLESYQVVLDAARGLLQRWLNRELSRSFFDYLRFNYDRKKFWENYVDRARSVRIMASSEIITRILSQNSNATHMRRHFISGLGNVPALIIEGKTRLFIEFGEAGNATFAYQKETGEQMINQTRHRDIKFLKDTNLPFSSTHRNYKKNLNTRLRHAGSWEKDYRNILELSGEFK